MEVVAADAPVALVVIDRANESDDADLDRSCVVAPRGVDISDFTDTEAARGGRLGSHRDIDNRRFVRGRRGGGGGPLAVDEFDMVANAFEPEHAGAIARIFIWRDFSDRGHEECCGRERMIDVGDVVARDPESPVDGVKGVLCQPAGESVGGIEDAHVKVGVGDAAQVGLQAEVLQGVAVDRRGSHQGHGEDHADADGGISRRLPLSRRMAIRNAVGNDRKMPPMLSRAASSCCPLWLFVCRVVARRQGQKGYVSTALPS